MDEFAWVIEAGVTHSPIYWDGGDWSSNNMRAVRFSRKVDAERIMINLPDEARRPEMSPAEHGWHDLPVRSSIGDEVIVNGSLTMWAAPVISYEQLVELAGYTGNPTALYVVARKPNGEKTGILSPGRSVDVEDGMRFTVCHTGNA